MALSCRYSALPEIEIYLGQGIERLGQPWRFFARYKFKCLHAEVVDVLRQNESLILGYSASDLDLAVDNAVEQVLAPYHNKLTLMSYTLLLGSIAVNAYLVTLLSDVPAMSAFVATLGGTLSGALGFQVLARLQAWAKQLSSRGGSQKTQIPFDSHALDIWRKSQQVKSDLPRDGRNIRKDSWLQLHARFEKANQLPDQDAVEAIADAIIDHRQSFSEVSLDVWLAREFYRNLKPRFANDEKIAEIKEILSLTAPIHGLPIEDLYKICDQILRKDT
jgi:hypothetical protein